MTVAVAIMLLSTAGLCYWLISQQLIQNFDATMLAKAQLLVTQVKEYADEIDFDFADEFMPEYERENNPEFFQIWQDGSGVFERSRSLKEEDLPLVKETEDDILIYDTGLPDKRRGRIVQVYFLPQLEDESDRTPGRIERQKRMHMVIARERESLDSQLMTLGVIILAVVIVLIGLIAVLIRRSVKEGLTPLASLRKAVSRTNIDNLDQCVDIGKPPEELELLVNQFNDMAHRIAESVKRERRFSADVAHELKTPIAELLNLAEVSLRWPENVTDHTSWFQDVLESSTAMQIIVDKLLKLSRCESGQVVLEPEELDLSEVLSTVCRRLTSLCDERGVKLDVQVDANFVFQSSRVEFELILQNILSNAVQYSPPDNAVVVRARASGDTGYISISNTAPHLCQEDLPVMFDRLWRKDQARGGHLNAGLGLPLVAAYAQILGLEIKTELDSEHLFSAHIENLRVI